MLKVLWTETTARRQPCFSFLMVVQRWASQSTAAPMSRCEASAHGQRVEVAYPFEPREIVGRDLPTELAGRLEVVVTEWIADDEVGQLSKSSPVALQCADGGGAEGPLGLKISGRVADEPEDRVVTWLPAKAGVTRSPVASKVDAADRSQLVTFDLAVPSAANRRLWGVCSTLVPRLWNRLTRATKRHPRFVAAKHRPWGV